MVDRARLVAAIEGYLPGKLVGVHDIHGRGSKVKGKEREQGERQGEGARCATFSLFSGSSFSPTFILSSLLPLSFPLQVLKWSDKLVSNVLCLEALLITEKMQGLENDG